MTETLPEGVTSYLDWMTEQTDALSDALKKYWPTRAPRHPSQRPKPAARSRSARRDGCPTGSGLLWQDLDLDVRPGEFLAVLGPNGSGKTSLLRVLLGLQPLSAGSVEVVGEPPGRANRRIGYIPQQRALDPTVTLRGRDLVGARVSTGTDGGSVCAARGTDAVGSTRRWRPSARPASRAPRRSAFRW